MVRMIKMASTRPCDLDEPELLVKTANKITSAMTSNHPFLLTFKQVKKIFNSQAACAYSGELFGTTGDITFERVNPRLGYVPGNVVLVKRHLNQLKGDTIDRFIHQSGMTPDALADLFSDLARSLRKEFAQIQESRAEKPKQISKLEERILLEVAAANPANGAQDLQPVAVDTALATPGARHLMQIFQAAKANKATQNETVPTK